MKTKSKILLTIAGAFALFSCGESSDSESATGANFEFSYTIDTVMVAAGEHFFFLNFGLGMSDVDQEKKLLYNFNNQELTLEVVDLENLNLKEVRQYEKEGPNGIGGGFIMNLNVLPDESILFFDFNGIHHVASDGQKIATYKLEEKKWIGDKLKENLTVNIASLDTKDGKTFYGFFGELSFDGKTEGLAMVNLEDESLKVFPSAFLDFSTAYDIKFEMDGRGAAKFPEQNRLRILNDQLIITSSTKNEIWQFDSEKDTLISHLYQSSLTSNSKKGNFPMKVFSNEEWTAAIKEKSKEVNFGALIQDSKESIYWRYSTEMDRLSAGDSIVFKTVLTGFDYQLNQLGEFRLPEHFKISSTVFFLDGMLYNFLNIEDELAFVRIKPKLHEN